MFICEFCKIFKNISWQSTSGWRTWIREELNLWWSCEMPTCKLMKKTLSHIVLYAFCLHFLRINTITFSEMLWRCVSTISFRKYNRKVIIYLFNYDSSKSIFFWCWIWNTISWMQFLPNKDYKNIALCVLISTFYKNLIVFHHGDNNLLFYFDICIKFTLSTIISTMKKW